MGQNKLYFHFLTWWMVSDCYQKLFNLFAGFAGQMTIFQKKFCFRSFWVNFGDIWRKLLFNINFKYWFTCGTSPRYQEIKFIGWKAWKTPKIANFEHFRMSEVWLFIRLKSPLRPRNITFLHIYSFLWWFISPRTCFDHIYRLWAFEITIFKKQVKWPEKPGMGG